jgi:hypothetical protein
MELREWQYMSKPANNSGSYKKRFEKLIKYHIDHASSELESITKKDIKDDGFWLGEHYNNSHHEFDRDLIVSYDKASDTFFFRIFIDGKEVDSILRNSYEDFVVAAEPYMFLPDSGTQEYDDLLTESLTEWKAMNPPPTQQAQASTSSQSAPKTNKEKFQELIKYYEAHKNPKIVERIQVNLLTDDCLLFEVFGTINYGASYTSIKIEVEDPATETWILHYKTKIKPVEVIQGIGWKNLLQALENIKVSIPAKNSQEYKDLCESYSSIADDFKLYANLWD